MVRTNRLFHMLIALLLVLGLAPPWAHGALAQEGSTLDSAVQDAVAEATGASPDGITVAVVAEEAGWAYGTATAGGEVSIFLAREGEDGWEVALRYTDAFSALLAEAPADFPSPEIRASLEGFTIAGDGSSDLSFPYPVGAIRDFSDAYYSNKISFFTHRPNTSGSYRDPNAAFPVLAMRGGIAYRPCDGLVMIDHGDGWATYYAYVGSIAVANGQAVTRGQQLGVTSNATGCAGAGYGDAVLVWLTRHGQLQNLNGIDIGGYTITTSEGGIYGSWTCLGRGDSGGDCTMYSYPNGIVNDGEQGTSAYPDAKITLDQNFPNLFTITGYPGNTLVTLTWQRPDGSQVPVGSIKTNPVGAASSAYVRPETSASEYPFPNLLIASAGTLARSVKTNAANSSMIVEGAGYAYCGTGLGREYCVAPGQEVTVIGTSLTRNLILTPSYLDAQGTRHPLPGTVTTSTLGRLNYTFTVPQFASEGRGFVEFRDADNYSQTSVVLKVTFEPTLILGSSRGAGGPNTAMLRNAAPDINVEIRSSGNTIGTGTTNANGSLDISIVIPPGSDFEDIYAFQIPGLQTITTARYWYDQTIVITPASAAPGAAVTLNMSGTNDSVSITVAWHNGQTWATIANGTTDSAGSISLPMTIPATATPGSTLTLRITVGGWYGYEYASVDVSGGSTQPLVANAGPDQTKNTSGTGASVTLNGSGSSPSTSIVSYLWSRAGQQIATGVSPSVTVPVGVHDIILTVTDNQGRVATDTMVATVTLTNPPSATLNPTSAAPGATVNFSIANFPANTTVDVLPPSITGEANPITSVQTNGSGAATGSFTVPDVPGGTLSFTFRTPDASATANLTVTAGIEFTTASIKRNAQATITGAGFPAGASVQLAWLNGSTWTTIAHTGGNSGGNGSVWVPFTVPASIPAGERQFRVTVGAVSAQTTVQVVLSDPPVADAGWDDTYSSTGPEGASVSLYGGNSYDPDGSIASYVWREGATQIATGANPTVTLAPGVHTITLTVTDNSGVTATDTVVITVTAFENDPPVANAGPDQTVTLTSGQTSAQVWLDGWDSYDPDGEIVSWIWKEGTTQIATGENTQVSFTAGVHTVTLTVTDDFGATDTDTVVIRVNAAANAAPTANAGADQTVTAPSGQSSAQVTLNGSGSTDTDGTISSYVWKNGATQIATGATPTVPLAVGTHTITLTVTDDDGATASDTVVITVNAAANPPIANAGPDQTVQTSSSSASVTLNGRGSSAPGSSITSYVWRNGATQVATGSQPTVTLAVGTHTLTLTVTAANGLTASDTVVITVSRISTTPTVTLNKTRTTVNSWVTYTISGYPANSPVQITWRRLSGSTIAIDTVTTDAAGSATGRFRVPATPGGPNQQITFSAGTVTKTLLFEVAPRIKVNTQPGVRGQQVDVSLRGYSRQEVVRIRWAQPLAGGGVRWVELARVTTSNTGSANVWVTVPSWAPDGANSVRGDGTVFRQQTNAVLISGGAFQPASLATPTPTPEPTPEATPLVVDGSARPAETPWTIVAISDDLGGDLLAGLTDGDVTTTWSVAAAAGTATLTVDLGDVITLTAVGWLPGDGADACGTLQALEQSADGQTWGPVDPARATGAIGAPGVWQVQAAGGTARFVRWTVTSTDSAHTHLGCLAELAVWGAGIVPVEPTAEPTSEPSVPPPAESTETPIESPVETPVATESPAATEPPAEVPATDSDPAAPAETTGADSAPAADPAPAGEEAPAA